MLRFVETKKQWGEFVFIKENAPLLLTKELKRIKRGKICIGTVCDPYLKIESKSKITRKILDELTILKNPISIQTKNSLILRDLDVLKEITGIEITITVTTVDEKIRKIFEPAASSVKDRIATAKELVQEGLPVDIFAGPLLPGLSDDEISISKFIKIFEILNIDSVLFDTLNPYPMVRKRMISNYEKYYPDKLQFLFDAIRNKTNYQKSLKKRLEKLLKKQKINYQILF